jgi:SH3-like domain-containing protein
MDVTTQSFRAAFKPFGRFLLAGWVVAMLANTAYAANDTGSASGLPVPRFVSLKSDRVNVRSGPNKDQDVRWVYTRAGMPVEVTAEFENWRRIRDWEGAEGWVYHSLPEFENWRRIRDWEGAEGWVYHSLLSGRRSAVVVPTLKDDLVPLYESADGESGVVAKLQSGVLGQLKTCNGLWCEFRGTNFNGWIKQERVWGAYPNEKVD